MDVRSWMIAHITTTPTTQLFVVSTFKRHAKKNCTRAATTA